MVMSLLHHALLHYFFFFFFFFYPTCILARPTPATVLSGTEIHHNSTWRNFKDLQDAAVGSRTIGVSNIKKYMHQFGYLKVPDFTDEFDSTFKNAIMRYQSKLGLAVTGELDSETLSQIMSPRCGSPDMATSSSNLHEVEHYKYFPGKPRWAARSNIPITLTYAFSPQHMITTLNISEIRRVFQRAFSRWSAVIPVNFTEAAEYGFADIRIGFYSGDHGDGESFDGVLGVLAHAFSPESGRFHLDAAETWAVDLLSEKSAEAVDLESVATHEIGHVLGLVHTSVKEAVMYPSLNPREKKLDLKMDDIKGIQALYGSNPNFRMEALSESYTSSNHAIDLNIITRSSTWMAILLVSGIFLYT